jgi:hypothetical protein
LQVAELICGLPIFAKMRNLKVPTKGKGSGHKNNHQKRVRIVKECVGTHCSGRTIQFLAGKKASKRTAMRPTRFHQVEKATELEINGRGHRKSRKETRDTLYCNRRLKHFIV